MAKSVAPTREVLGQLLELRELVNQSDEVATSPNLVVEVDVDEGFTRVLGLDDSTPLAPDRGAVDDPRGASRSEALLQGAAGVLRRPRAQGIELATTDQRAAVRARSGSPCRAR